MQKKTGTMLFVVLFLVFMGIFSFFRSEIAEYVASLLAMTNEITVSRAKTGNAKLPSAIQIVTDNKLIAAKKKTGKIVKKSASPDTRFKKPVTVNLPKTKTPTISYAESFPEWRDSWLNLFTPLRKYDGTIWRNEKTEIKGSTNGKKLYLLCRFYDKTPSEAVTSNTEGGKSGNNAWRDDSIEVFLMKDRKSKFYNQYIVSVTGKGTVFHNMNATAPNQGTKTKLPEGFVKPRYRSYEFNGGFEIEITISLSNIGIKEIKPGDSLLMQIVRNYRGQGYKNSIALHLFPVYIYADKRMGVNNHDRRAFQKVVITKVNKHL